jgi:hypothetical protein
VSWSILNIRILDILLFLKANFMCSTVINFIDKFKQENSSKRITWCVAIEGLNLALSWSYRGRTRSPQAQY